MADPKVRIDSEVKEKMDEEIKNNPEYSSQKAFVSKAVRILLENESKEITKEQKEAIRNIVKEELE